MYLADGGHSERVGASKGSRAPQGPVYWVSRMPSCAKCHRDVVAGALFCASCGAAIVPEPAPGEAADPYIGQTFKGMYFIQRRVGAGGMGYVYKAMHVTLDVPVALKILKKALLADPAIVQRFHREARAASRLRHPNVIGVTDFGQTEDGTLFMAMEYVTGKSLARVIAEEFPLTERRVVHIGAQVLAALAEAHAAGILHRDLKPENVMLESRRDETDSVKVLDFGIAKIQLPGGEGTQPALTQAGLVCGTPGYMSPEQWSAEELDARSDLYAVGVLLYEMLTGKLPFEATTPMAMARKHLTEQPVPPSQRRLDHGVSADLDALVMRALSVDREQRPASADEMRADLLACVLLPEPEVEAEAQGEARKTVVLPREGTPRTAPATRSRTPGAARKVTPGASPRTGTEAMPRPPAGGVGPTPSRQARPPGRRGGRTPTTPLGAARAPVTPRHEMDEEGVEGGEESLAPATPRPRLPVLVAVAVAVLAVVGVGIFALRGSPRRPPAVAEVTAKAPEPTAPPATPPPVVAEPLPRTPEPPPPEPPRAEPPKPEPAPVKTPEPLVARAPRPTPRPRLPAASPGPAETPVPLAKGNCSQPLHWEHGLEKISTPEPGTGDGVLVIRALPWGQVSVCGAPYGDAPLELRVHAGKYAVRVEHASKSDEKTITVAAGARVPFAVDFTKLQ